MKHTLESTGTRTNIKEWKEREGEGTERISPPVRTVVCLVGFPAFFPFSLLLVSERKRTSQWKRRRKRMLHSVPFVLSRLCSVHTLLFTQFSSGNNKVNGTLAVLLSGVRECNERMNEKKPTYTLLTSSAHCHYLRFIQLLHFTSVMWAKARWEKRTSVSGTQQKEEKVTNAFPYHSLTVVHSFTH